jgi:hypothetical protein
MSFLSGGDRTGGGAASNGRPVRAYVEQRPTSHTEHVCSGTLACPGCDAPIALGGELRSLTDRLSCPFCGHTAAARHFLSLAKPTRAAHVSVRLSRPVTDQRLVPAGANSAQTR